MKLDRDFEIRERGKLGEQYVCEYLRSRGCEIKAVNYSSRFGEIDIIAENEADTVISNELFAYDERICKSSRCFLDLITDAYTDLAAVTEKSFIVSDILRS